MPSPLSGKVVLITGAARGIGAETARRAAARGARVALVGLEPERLAALAAELGAEHRWFEADVTDQAALDRAVSATVEAMGGIDAVFANAGIASVGTVAVSPVEALARTIEVNVIGVVRTVSATLPHVTARRGYFLLMASASALAPLPGMASYSASKIAVERFGDALRLEVTHKGVQVGVAYPSWIDTDMVRSTQQDLKSFNQTLARLPGPLGKVTSLEECADAMVDALERRVRKVFVPGSLSRYAVIRQLITSRWGERPTLRGAARMIPRMEAEVQALGRSFGAHTVGVPPLADIIERPAS
ncbi:MAG TPA: SDR family oxidoreductase [Longimicrobium sp.]|nr:SDR family oxidoreductase [Longimicrobium sp.]